jgi:hypothetical protein
LTKPLQVIEKAHLNEGLSKTIGYLFGNFVFRPKEFTLAGINDHNLMKKVFSLIV